MPGPLEEVKRDYSVSLDGELAQGLETAGQRAGIAPEALLESALNGI